MLLANIEDQNKKLGNNEKVERFHKSVGLFGKFRQFSLSISDDAN
jgi:hypothetical protein